MGIEQGSKGLFTPWKRAVECPTSRYHVGQAIAFARAQTAHHARVLHWIDTHCHLDAAEFDADRAAMFQRGRDAGVATCVLPAIDVHNFDAVRALAHAQGVVYALGIHPLRVPHAAESDLQRLRERLHAWRDDPRLVAVGEIGLDHFVPGLDRARQQHFYREQLEIARDAALPVLLHVRRSVDAVLAGLRRLQVRGGIAHAFNGSEQQAMQLIELGFKLGFGGEMTHERALRIRRLAATLPDAAIVLETDAPDIPPQWLYRNAQQRLTQPQARNEPAELPRIGATLAELRGWTLARTAEVTTANARSVLPRLQA